MEARQYRAALLVALLPVLMGARSRNPNFTVETPNFIVEAPDLNLAREIGRAAEKCRHDLAVEWLGKAMPNWSQPCFTTVRVGPNLGAGAATRFAFDRGEVSGWRMTIQGSRQRLIDSVLPHEITHMIFASHFRRPVPRWADEGAATYVEHVSERNVHRRKLIEFLRTGRGIPFNQMLAMEQYPRDIMPLYAQSYSLAEYLIQHGGKRKYLAFLGDGMKAGDWATAIRRHYGISSTGALQKTWLAWVRNGSPKLKSPQTLPPASPPATMVADSGRRPRPEPVVFRIPKQQRPTSPPEVGIVAKGPPRSGWRAVGTETPRTAVATAPRAMEPEPIRTLARPQPPQRVRPTYLR